MTNEALIALLKDCYPFLVHALCTIPEDNENYAKVEKLIKVVDPIAHAKVHAAFKKQEPKWRWMGTMGNPKTPTYLYHGDEQVLYVDGGLEPGNAEKLLAALNHL